MRLATAAGAIRQHPRHVLLFALTAGLLTGPLSPAATIAAAGLAAALLVAARVPLWSVLPLGAVAAVLAGAAVANVRIRALEGGPLPHMLGRAIQARAVLLEPVRVRP